MKNLELLFSENNKFFQTSNRYNFTRGTIQITIKDKFFNNNTILSIISIVNTIHKKYNFAKLPIQFVFLDIYFFDKASYVLFECICNTLIVCYGHKLSIKFNFNYNILTAGIKSSPLLILGSEDKSWNTKNEKFVNKFNFEIYQKHFRKVVKYEDCKDNNRVSKMYDDIVYFQKTFDINYECREEISEVIVELVGNSIEHSYSDCLLDFDIAPDYKKNGEDFCGINISIINLSRCLLGDALKDKIESGEIDLDKSTERYKKVSEAHTNHKNFFDGNYDNTDFFNISVFQHKISGRKDNSLTGGTGLTKLIKTIEERADAHSCFVKSGDRKIFLKPEFLQNTEDDWIGFNEKKDYFNNPPDKSILKREKLYIPGTVYNLNFVMKVDKT